MGPKTSLCRVAGLACAVALSTGGCKKPGAVAAQMTESPDLAQETGQAKCGVRKSVAKPLVVEWPGAERAALEARASRSLVAVRYEGCQMEVLSNCTVAGNYEYVGLTQKREGVRINSADELYAKLPVGAAGLEGKLQRAGQLNVDMAIVGRMESSVSRFGDRQLEGRCDTATHVVTGLTVGAFSFYAGESAEVSGSVEIGNIGGGVGSSAEREVLRQDGNGASCLEASTADTTPPEGCAALLRVEVVPIDRVGAPMAGPTPAATTASSEPAQTQAEMAERNKKIRNMGLLAYGSLALAAAGVGAGVIGISLNRSRKDKLPTTDPGSDRQDAIRQLKTGQGLTYGGFAAGVAFFVVGIVLSKRTQTLKSGGTLSVAPAPRRGGGTLSLGGRFAP